MITRHHSIPHHQVNNFRLIWNPNWIYIRPVLTKWAMNSQESTGDMALWTYRHQTLTFWPIDKIGKTNIFTHSKQMSTKQHPRHGNYINTIEFMITGHHFIPHWSSKQFQSCVKFQLNLYALWLLKVFHLLFLNEIVKISLLKL